LAQLGTALAIYGDPGRADALFRRADERFRRRPEDLSAWRVDYGSDARDRAAVLTLAVEAGSEAVNRNTFADAIALRALPGRTRSTQEQVWTVLAAHAMGAGGAPAGFTVNGVAPDGPAALRLEPADLASGVVLENGGAADLPTVISVFGTPAEGEPAGGNGYSIRRGIYTLAGDPVEPGQIRRNDRLVVVLTVRPQRPQEGRLIVDDPLPGGFEIDNPRLLSSGDVSGLSWLDLQASARATAAQTDRFTAAVDWRGTDPFHLAYIVRAISDGEFHHPAPSVEDMYRPAFRAWGEAGRIIIR
jgi:uncharacterized protein YfaS (alpha-2-macroglobulin family)